MILAVRFIKLLKCVAYGPFLSQKSKATSKKLVCFCLSMPFILIYLTMVRRLKILICHLMDYSGTHDRLGE